MIERKRMGNGQAVPNRQLQEFLDRLVHDLREPLRSITTFSELLSENSKDALDAEGEQLLSEILAGASRMRHLVDGVAQFAAVFSRDSDPDVTSLNLAFNAAVAALDPQIRSAGAVVTSDSLPRVSIGLSRSIQLFDNLIRNSLKFRREEPPRIHASAQADGPVWTIRFEDNGMGIAPNDFETIFKPFGKVYGRKYPGAGLGLTVCRAIIERQGGTIWVESEPGHGSAFLFSLQAA